MWLSILVAGDAHLFDHHVSARHRTVVAGPQPAGGFRLRVSVPLARG